MITAQMIIILILVGISSTSGFIEIRNLIKDRKLKMRRGDTLEFRIRESHVGNTCRLVD
jgi:hypothetical protein